MDTKELTDKICERYADMLNLAVWSKIDGCMIPTIEIRELVQADIYRLITKKIDKFDPELFEINDDMVSGIAKNINRKLRFGIYNVLNFILSF